MIPNQILSQSLLREVNKPDNEGPFSKPTIPQPSFQERDIISRLKNEDKLFESMKFKNAPTNIQKMNDLMDLKRKKDIKPTAEDEDYQKLLKQLEYATAKNAQYKQDMNMIDAALEQLDPKKKILIGTDIDKKFAYESLRSKRMQIREKEQIFLDQLQQFHDYYSLNERNRIEKGIVNEDFLKSKKDKIRDLKLMHEQLDYDKTNFLDQFDKIRSGYSLKAQPYFTAVGASTLGLGGNPSYLAVDYDLGRVRDKLQDESRRIERMKQDNMYYYTRNHLPVDPEEAFGSNKINFNKEVKYLMDTNKYAPSTEEKYQKLKLIRENLEKLGAEKGLNFSKVKLQFIEETPENIQEYQQTIRDIENLRSDYIQSGGTDPEFLLNLQNLEQFYKQTRFNPINKDILRQQQGLPVSNVDPPGFYYNSTVNGGNQLNSSQLYNQSAVMQNSSLVQGRQFPGMQPQVALNQSLVDPQEFNKDEQSITNHPIYEYLPESFKKQVVEMEQKNKNMKYDLSSVHMPPIIDIPTSLVDPSALKKSSVGGDTDYGTEEQMLNYVRGQEAELLLNMSRLNPNQVEYSAKHSQFLQVQQIKSSLERSILDKKVQSALKGANQSMNQSVLGNVSIVNGGTSESMNLAHLSRASTMYSPNEGFMLRFDWIGSLPINYSKIKVNFGIFRKGDNFFPYRDTTLFQTEQETYRSNKCIMLQKEVIRDVQPFPDTVLYIEFWGFQNAGEGILTKPEVIGWSMHEIFDYNGNISPGKFRLPFYSKVFQPNEIFNEGLPYMSNSALFIRVCLPMDPYFDVDSTILLQNEYRVQDLHQRKKKILKLDENSQYIPDVSNRYLYGGYPMNDSNIQQAAPYKNISYPDGNQSSWQNQDQSTMAPNISKPSIVVKDENQKVSDFSQFGPQNPNKSQQNILIPNQQNNSSQMPKSSFQIKSPQGSNAPTKRNLSIAPSNISESNKYPSSTSIEIPGTSKLDPPKSLRIRLLKLQNVKTEVSSIQIRSVIFQKNEILLTKNKNPSADNVKLDKLQVNKNQELQMNVQMDQDIDWKDLLQKYSKRDLEKILFYCAIFKSVVGKEDELLGWLVWPIFKIDNDYKMVNAGIFTTNIFKKPAQKPPFGEKKEKSEIQMQFEIEAVGAQGGDTKNLLSLASSKQINLGDDDEDKQSQFNPQSTKVIEQPKYDNKKKLVIDLHSLSKYLLTKNDLQYKIEVVKDSQPIADENGHKCIEQQDIRITDKGKEKWKFDQEQKFEIGQINLMNNFTDNSHSKGFIIISVLTKGKGDLIGLVKVPLFQNNSTNLNEGRNKTELVKIEKNGTEKPQKYILDYSINYINIDEANQKVYDPNKGIRVKLHELSNYREKYDVTYQFHAMIGKEKLKNNFGQPCEVFGQDFIARDEKKKNVMLDENFFVHLDLGKIQDFYRKELDEIYILFEIVIDKSVQGTKDNEEDFAWYAHPLFIDSKPNLGRFNVQLYKLPKELDNQPINPLKMKKMLIKFDFEIIEQTGDNENQSAPQSNVQPDRKSNRNPTVNINELNNQSKINNNPDSNKFNIFIGSINKIKFKQKVQSKLAIIFKDDIFKNDNGQPTSFTGEFTQPMGDSIQFDEEYDIDLDLQVLKAKYPKQLDQFYFFVNFIDEKSKSVLWFSGNIFKDGDLRAGDFTENLYEPPIIAKLSQGTKNAKKSTSQIEYRVAKGFGEDSGYEEN
ncbi:hypothetical protein TTHERM_00473280 (macronuclear) [Tetrahymena thermophila SB210]|uniref:Uncharacterized protein n=1 Tax=Tetrahymena thermophila (strain SB210) TaxID=312017 RepID=I7MA40_TETTS|nr:hypothetical protein TTHERM_00473280 [Tetrahymena thermophila SB210]EAS03666.2 hypothetical protein TTHERM_00473280 [Tetrahymena thermophila SB210]|eukprot:XP_001023911.2 hypothetical protein TTHERM_00473280 [Tetrahymena thermophila SB210]